MNLSSEKKTTITDKTNLYNLERFNYQIIMKYLRKIDFLAINEKTFIKKVNSKRISKKRNKIHNKHPYTIAWHMQRGFYDISRKNSIFFEQFLS